MAKRRKKKPPVITSRRAQPHRAGRRVKRGRPLLKLAGFGVLAGGLGALLFAGYAMFGLPEVDAAFTRQEAASVVYYDAGERVIARRGVPYAPPVRLGDLPDHVAQAVLAVEDRRFYGHFGVDVIGIGRAVVVNFAAGRVVQGGSTITQQLAKNLFLTPERTLKRKAQEAILALELERRFSKDEILALYLSRVYFGAGAWGVEAAAERYFGKPASRLTLGEAALLAGLLKAPSRYSPVSDVARAEARATVVLDVMTRQGKISEAGRQAAFDAPVTVLKDQGRYARHFLDWVEADVRALVGEPRENLIIETTLDLEAQKAAEAAVRAVMNAAGAGHKAGEGALIALDQGGEVRAMAGGRDYSQSQFNRAVQARRQPGSAFKPFVYLAAFEAGLSPWDVREDAPVALGDWRPANFNDKYEGEMALATAFARSSNSVAVRLGEEVGRDAVIRAAKRLGVRSRLAPNRSLALGAQEVTLTELAAAYSPFANGGWRVRPFGIVRIRTEDGDVLYERGDRGAAYVVNGRELALMNLVLEKTVAEGTGRRARLDSAIAGGKTGTTNDFRDAWFVGYAGGLTAGVWVGNDDNSPMGGVTGGTLPADIWKRFMSAALALRPEAA